MNTLIFYTCVWSCICEQQSAFIIYIAVMIIPLWARYNIVLRSFLKFVGTVLSKVVPAATSSHRARSSWRSCCGHSQRRDMKHHLTQHKRWRQEARQQDPRYPLSSSTLSSSNNKQDDIIVHSYCCDCLAAYSPLETDGDEKANIYHETARRRILIQQYSI